MKILIFAAILGLSLARHSMLAPLLAVDSPTAIDGEYLVVFKNEVGDNEVLSHKEAVRGLMANGTSKIKSEWQIGKDFRGYAAIMDDRLLNEVRGMTEVKYVERNQIATIDQTQCDLQSGAIWGLVRTTLHEWDSNPNDPPNDYEHKKESGNSVTAFVIDTGIDDTHPLFQGRADRGVDFVDNPPPSNGDPNGHGTHVAGTIMSDIYGLARGATATAVRVLNASGSGSFAGIIDGVNYVAEKKKEDDKMKAVANMSLGGGVSDALNDAVNACVGAGVHMSVSAGNNNFDSCNKSPASAEMPVTTAASDVSDTKASFSNYGSCVDIIAPGVDIISTTPNGGTASYSGTSMSAPHVAGVMAKILSETDEYDNPVAMKAYLKSEATKGKITGFPASPPTDNDLLFHDCE